MLPERLELIRFPVFLAQLVQRCRLDRIHEKNQVQFLRERLASLTAEEQVRLLFLLDQESVPMRRGAKPSNPVSERAWNHLASHRTYQVPTQKVAANLEPANFAVLRSQLWAAADADAALHGSRELERTHPLRGRDFDFLRIADSRYCGGTHPLVAESRLHRRQEIRKHEFAPPEDG
jgi:hypothetical protein